jgi:hypothetical protein
VRAAGATALRELEGRDLTFVSPLSHRYRVTDLGLRHALFLTRAHSRLLHTGLAELAEPPPTAPSKIRTAARAYETAINDLLTRAGLAA